MRIIFMGTPDFALPALAALVSAQRNPRPTCNALVNPHPDCDTTVNPHPACDAIIDSHPACGGGKGGAGAASMPHSSSSQQPPLNPPRKRVGDRKSVERMGDRESVERVGDRESVERVEDAPELEVIAVYTQPPRPKNRGQKLQASPVQQFAEAHSIPVYHPTSLKTPQAQAEFAALNADLAVVVAYGLILPQAILDAPTFGCMNIHPSALPRWRGAAPIQRTLMAGDDTTQICIMNMDAGLDTGDVYLRSELIPLSKNITAGELHDLLATKAAPLLLEAIYQLSDGRAAATPQVSHGVTYADKITKDDCQINWSQPADTIHNHIRGLSPFPGAWTKLGDEVLKIYKATIIPSPSGGGLGRGPTSKPQPTPSRRFPIKEILQNARELRKDLTDSEQLMWYLLRRKQLGVKFRRQHPLGKYVADFLSIEAKLIIELDGSQHSDSTVRSYDAVRTQFFEQQGYRVLRFWNHQVLQETQSVLEVIYDALQGARGGPLPSPPPIGEGITGITLDNQLTIQCGDGVIRLLEVQKPGKPRMEADAFLRGHPVAKGTKLG